MEALGQDGVAAPEVLAADTEDAVRRCWPVFRELRPHIPDEAEFVRRWNVQRREGYRMVWVEQDGAVVAVAGYRYLHAMAWGQVLYLDDLVAHSGERGRGWGSVLLHWLKDEARRQGCDELHLDTGYTRHAAHRAYLRNGFELNCHHLAWRVTGP